MDSGVQSAKGSVEGGEEGREGEEGRGEGEEEGRGEGGGKRRRRRKRILLFRTYRWYFLNRRNTDESKQWSPPNTNNTCHVYRALVYHSART